VEGGVEGGGGFVGEETGRPKALVLSGLLDLVEGGRYFVRPVDFVELYWIVEEEPTAVLVVL
jgi:hypothetical protein